MEIIKVGILAIVQGITELLPISSSGHLIVLGNFFSIDTDTLLLSVFHFGTTLAIILFFWKELFKDIFTKKKLTFYLKILVSTIPAAIIGFFFQEIIEDYLRATWIIGVSLIVWGIVMVLLDNREKNKKKEIKNIENISWKQSVIMGFAQVLALIPGTSRSGITTIAGILGGLDKYTALEYSFLLGIPILLGSSIYEVGKSILLVEGGITSTIISASIIKIAVVAIIPFIVGYISLVVLKRFKKKNWLTVFGAYRIFLGSLILLCLL